MSQRSFKVKKFKKLDSSVLEREAREIYSQLDVSKGLTDTKRIELENELEKKLYELDKARNQDAQRSSTLEIMDEFYPELSDPYFNEKIYSKKEFYIHRTPDLNTKLDSIDKLEPMVQESCGTFKLSNNQKFLKAFMNSNTPYKSLLLFHGTGVGKTCSSLSIAEGYSEELEKNHKKIIVVLNPSIKENFKKNIFNIVKYRTKKVHQQCLRDTYLKKIKSLKRTYPETDEEMTEKYLSSISGKVDRRIASKYSFIGYQAFANRVKKMIADTIRMNPKKVQNGTIESEIDKRISNYYSDCVMIIDEVHNVKEGDEGKSLPPLLERVVKCAENMKLVLLSATPMFNEPQEILYILNLLLLNSKLPRINPKDIFKRNGELKENGAEILKLKSRGLVSYLRGENPITFPKRLYPDSEIMTKFPKLDYEGNPFDGAGIENLKIVPCEMVKDGNQLNVYNQVSEHGFGAFDSVGISVSNIAFPQAKASDTYKTMVSNSGFFNSFSKNYRKKKLQITPKFAEARNMLNYNEIGKYSTKIRTIMDNIKKANGIVFVYSRFVWSGVVSLALALEMAGASNFSGNLLNSDIERNPVDGINGIKYMIISGDKDLSSDAYKNYIKDELSNINGDRVKVILGSESASEGLDFKYIREVHIMDPWFHLNKLEQVIGRGIRYCSHVSLPPMERNVTIYMYAAVKSVDEEIETVDLKVYREAEHKDKNMAVIERILKENSVDCGINKNMNVFNSGIFSSVNKFPMRNSRGEVLKNVSLSDLDNTRICNYTECNFTCNSSLDNQPLDESQIEKSTFKFSNTRDEIYEVALKIRELFKSKMLYKSDELYELIKGMIERVDDQIMFLAIDALLSEDIQIEAKSNNNCRLVYTQNYYLALPLEYYVYDSSGVRVPINALEQKLKLRKGEIDITSPPDISFFKQVEDADVEEQSSKKDTKLSSSSEKTDNELVIELYNLLIEGNFHFSKVYSYNDRVLNYKFLYNLDNINEFIESNFESYKEGRFSESSQKTILKSRIERKIEPFSGELMRINQMRKELENFDEFDEIIKRNLSLSRTISEFKNGEIVLKSLISQVLLFNFTNDSFNKDENYFRVVNDKAKTLDFYKKNSTNNKFELVELRSEDYSDYKVGEDTKVKIKYSDLGDLFGFIDYDLSFKIKDARKSKSKVRGSACENEATKKIVDYILESFNAKCHSENKLTEDLFKKMNETKGVEEYLSREILCNILIYSFLKNNKFLSLEEYHILKKNKKI